MRNNCLLILLLFALPLQAQSPEKMLDVRFGGGLSLLGSGDMRTFNYESELNIKINSFVATAFSAAFGKSNDGVYEMASFMQANLNFFVSPFRNTRKNDFRIGAGLSFFNVSDAYQTSAEYDGNIVLDVDYDFDTRTTMGYNIIIENSYDLSEKFLIGIKLFTQPYLNGDINSGGLLKFGIKI